MCKVCLVVLIGLPGAGKTTFCNQLRQKLQSEENFNSHIVTYDDIITNYQTQYKELRNRAIEIAENTIKSIISSQNSLLHHVIIIDDNMYYKSMRYEYYKLAKKYNLSFLQVYFKVELEIALVRNKIREQKCQVPENVVINMHKKFEIPGQEHWESNLFIINAVLKLDEGVLDQVFGSICGCLNTPVIDTLHKTTGPLPISRLQNIDLILRRIVHEKIKTDKSHAETFAKKKKEIYQSIKDHNIVINDESSELQLYDFLKNLF